MYVDLIFSHQITTSIANCMYAGTLSVTPQSKHHTIHLIFLYPLFAITVVALMQRETLNC